MAHKFKNISQTNEKDPRGIKKAGNNLLLGIGNVLDASSVKKDDEEKGETSDKEAVEKGKVNATKVGSFSFHL